MADIHPHWQNTDGTSNDVPETHREQSPVQSTTLSRRPAALFGVFCVLSLFATFVHTSSPEFTADVAGTGTVSIRITETGVEPVTVEVTQGQTITWTNETTTPQIILSDTLCDADGICLFTEPFYEGETQSFYVAGSVGTGNHDFSSATMGSIFGSVTVLEGTNVPETIADATSSSEPLHSAPTTEPDTEIALAEDLALQAEAAEGSPPDTPTGTSDNSGLEFKQTSTGQQFVQAKRSNKRSKSYTPPVSNRPRSIQNSAIPTNPYTVGSEPVGETSTQESTHQGAPLIRANPPVTQPRTGAGFLVIALLSVAGLVVAFRKELRLS